MSLLWSWLEIISRCIEIALLILVGVVAVAVGFAVRAEKRTRQQMREAARQSRCVRCGALLGEEALALADAEWAKMRDELDRSHFYRRYRMVRTWRAICPGCGARYSYQEATRAFVLLPDEPPRESS
ncbi:hypothetical protein [Silvibacterium dinghuense]|uniref:Uncharacterized protein n=1 Tax=Silvibacterium dinghuense TaxID=1560006 RepID=A0A4Q1S9X1_9BACT|nr:hypothetical protein [Silvibacterium dinghuense]RXS93863.1 hypothetical protein ESZ00_17655 [Silvibacterium dinghuense]GGH08301.1 hypothetical protein GCM10011586_25800 [Silvibacterium dinghuense]